MADETEADDEALYDVWARLTPEQVDALHNLLDFLANYRRSPGYDHGVARAMALLLVAYGLGHLPDVAAEA